MGRRGVESSRIVVDCESPTSIHSGTDYLSTIELKACPEADSDLARLLSNRTRLICVPDQVYKRFVRDNLNLLNRKPVRIIHMRHNETETRILRRRLDHDDLRLVSPADPSVYIDMRPERYSRQPSIAFVNERLSSVLDRLVSPAASSVDERDLAISPIIYEYIRSNSGNPYLMQVRSYRDGEIIAGFQRELSPQELVLRTNITATDGGIHHVHTDSLDPDGLCCFCDEPKHTFNTSLVKLCCFHEYHQHCIRSWIFEHGKSNCPECRRHI